MLDKFRKRCGFKTTYSWIFIRKESQSSQRGICSTSSLPTPLPPGHSKKTPPDTWETLLKIVEMKCDNLKEIPFLEYYKGMEIDI